MDVGCVGTRELASRMGGWDQGVGDGGLGSGGLGVGGLGSEGVGDGGLMLGSEGVRVGGVGVGKVVVLASNRLRVKSSCTLGHLGQMSTLGK